MNRPLAQGDPFATFFRLKQPCADCPFRRRGAIPLEPGRLADIKASLLEDDHMSFSCHKTVHGPRGGDWTDDGQYLPSGHEAMCAGAAAFLMRHQRPSVAMRIAFATGAAAAGDWNAVMPVLDVDEVHGHE